MKGKREVVVSQEGDGEFKVQVVGEEVCSYHTNLEQVRDMLEVIFSEQMRHEH